MIDTLDIQTIADFSLIEENNIRLELIGVHQIQDPNMYVHINFFDSVGFLPPLPPELIL